MQAVRVRPLYRREAGPLAECAGSGHAEVEPPCAEPHRVARLRQGVRLAAVALAPRIRIADNRPVARQVVVDVARPDAGRNAEVGIPHPCRPPLPPDPDEVARDGVGSTTKKTPSFRVRLRVQVFVCTTHVSPESTG